LLVLVACMSAVLDNIAAALIGGSAAITLFRRKVHIGYLAAIVAASNAGGAGSVVGDTTTTMIWLAGVSPFDVIEAAVGAAVAVAFFGWFAAGQQQGLQPLVRGHDEGRRVDLPSVGVVLLILGGAIWTNIAFGLPAAGVWGAILLGALVRQPDWKVVPSAAVGACFLLSLVLSASMMPVDDLPAATPWSATSSASSRCSSCSAGTRTRPSTIRTRRRPATAPSNRVTARRSRATPASEKTRRRPAVVLVRVGGRGAACGAPLPPALHRP
jgi:hypothetical protein